MKRLLKILLLVVPFFFVNCNNKTTENSVVITNGIPQISFEHDTHNFGNIMQGEKVAHIFRYKNIGNAPLLVREVTTSCGCTAPKYSTEPLNPGCEGEIEVVFDSYGRTGKQLKTVSVWTNCSEKPISLRIFTNIEVKN